MFRQGQTSGPYTPPATPPAPLAASRCAPLFRTHCPRCPPSSSAAARAREHWRRQPWHWGAWTASPCCCPTPSSFCMRSYAARPSIPPRSKERNLPYLDLLLFELGERPGAPIDEVVEVSNGVAALEHGHGSAA
jgi:hypothetical protein